MSRAHWENIRPCAATTNMPSKMGTNVKAGFVPCCLPCCNTKRMGNRLMSSGAPIREDQKDVQPYVLRIYGYCRPFAGRSDVVDTFHLSSCHRFHHSFRSIGGYSRTDCFTYSSYSCYELLSNASPDFNLLVIEERSFLR